MTGESGNKNSEDFWQGLRARAAVIVISVLALLAASVLTYFAYQDNSAATVAPAETEETAAEAADRSGDEQVAATGGDDIPCVIRLLIEDEEGEKTLKLTPKDESAAGVAFDTETTIKRVQIEGCR